MMTTVATSDPSALGFWITSLSGGIHTLAALLALLLGPLIFLRRKGNGAHRWLVRVWAVSMIVLNVSALMTYELGGRPNVFHVFAVVSLLTLGLGWWSVYRYVRTREPGHLSDHLEYMGWAYFGLAAAGLWQVVISLARAGAIGVPYPVLFTGLGLATALCSVGLLIWFRSKSPIWSGARAS